MCKTNTDLKKLLTIFAMVILVLSFVACSSKSTSNNDDDPTSGEGWPPANILSEFELTGIVAPTGSTSHTWEVTTEIDTKTLTIGFRGNSTTDAAFTTQMTEKGWTIYGESYPDVDYYRHYVKGDLNAVYIRDGNECAVAVNKPIGTPPPPPPPPDGWPPASILAEFGLTGLNPPAGGSGFTYLITNGNFGMVFNGTSATDTSVHSQMLSIGWTEFPNPEPDPDLDFEKYYSKGNLMGYYDRERTDCFLGVIPMPIGTPQTELKDMMKNLKSLAK